MSTDSITKNPEIKYTKLFINNEWVNSISGKTFETRNPATEKVIASVQEGDKADVDIAVKAAVEAFKFDSPWRTMDASQRGLLLFRLADLIEKNKNYIASVESCDNGKPINLTTMEIGLAVKNLRYFGGYADKVTGLTLPVDGPLYSMTVVEPVGVVGGILPWNYPFHLLVLKAAPAMAAGCTMVIKPAEQTPLTALIFAALLKEVGIPKGVFNVIPGYGPTAGSALVNHSQVDKVSFTGSTEVGRLILQGSGQSNLKRVGLEMGGKSPLIVCEDVEDLKRDVKTIVGAAMASAGQCCVAATRTFVEASIYDEFIQLAKAELESYRLGDPFETSTQQGPQIDDVQTTKIMELIESGKKEGAKLVTGGCRRSGKGYYVNPTLFCDVQDNMRIAREEIFGPVMSVFKFTKLDDAVERANDTEYGLGGAIFTSNITKALSVAKRVRAGNFWINTYLANGPQTPFGGYKQSGHEREGGPYGIDAYLEKKTITINLPKKL